MITQFSVLPFLIGLVIAVAAMPTDVVQVNAYGMGHEHTLPWRRRSSLYTRLVSAVQWIRRLLRSRTLIASAACALAMLSIHLGADPAHAAPVGLVFMGDLTMAEVKEALDKSNQLFEGQFKQITTQIKALEEKGAAVDPLLKEQQEKLGKAMDSFSALNEKFIEIQLAVKRAEAGGFQAREGVIEEKALKRFNGELKALAMERGRAVVEVDAAGAKAYNEAYEQFLRKGEQKLTEAERKALSVGNDINGGYMVSPDLTGKAVTRMFETSPMRLYSSQQTISTDALEGTVDLEEASFGWVSELGTRSESNTPAVPRPWRIPVHEAYAEPRISQKLAEDSQGDPVAWLAKKTGDKFGRGYNTAFVTGSGVGKPRGFASYTSAATADGSRDWGVFEHVATGQSGAFDTDPSAVTKMLSVIHALKDHFLANAAWYMNRTTLGYLRTKTDASSAGKFIFIPSFQAGAPDTVLGYPVRKMQDMANYSTADALAIAFGDMLETYQIVDRLGITVLVDPYTAKPYIKYYTRGRVGGDVLNFEAMKFIKFGS